MILYEKIRRIDQVYLNMANSGLDRIKQSIGGRSACEDKWKMQNTIFSQDAWLPRK